MRDFLVKVAKQHRLLFDWERPLIASLARYVGYRWGSADGYRMQALEVRYPRRGSCE